MNRAPISIHDADDALVPNYLRIAAALDEVWLARIEDDSERLDCATVATWTPIMSCWDRCPAVLDRNEDDIRPEIHDNDLALFHDVDGRLVIQ